MSIATGVDVVSFGCRLNIAESETMAVLARDARLTDTIIVNTCAVTAEAERQARQTIRRLRRERPGASIVVTGCAAQIDPARFAAMPEVTRVLGNAEKLDPACWRATDAPRIAVADIARLKETSAHLATGFTQHTRAFVEVQQGCDHRCTFCIIPFGRGPSRSLAMGEIARHVAALVEQGAREVVLTGVDLTAYGRDLPGQPSLAQMVRRLLAAVPTLERLRLSSLDPAEIDDALIALIGREARLMPHIHLSLQSGDDLILKRMKRRHSRAQALDVIARLRAARPGLALGADLIAGFPTESDFAFANTMSLIADASLAFVHVFPYSPRPGTPAARMPQINGRIIQARTRALRAAAQAAQARFLNARIGETAEVLVERSGRSGHGADFSRVELDQAAAPGSLVRATIIAAGADRLMGHLAA
jgi:threonylcarbamoyladenosine tRNA methylthiotransferase MtaB